MAARSMNLPSSSRRAAEAAWAAGSPRRDDEVVDRVPPELGHAVVARLGVAARLQGVVDRRVDRVALHVAPDAEDLGDGADERPVLVLPVAVELVGLDLRRGGGC